MESQVVTRLKKLGPNLSMTGVIITLAVGVLVPVLLSTSVGIISLAMGNPDDNLVIGILVICFSAAAIGSTVTATVLLGRKARTARRQADFLANVTHELRTPLTAIRMYAQTLLTGQLENDSERSEQCLKTIIRETEWLETMIDQVLTWRSAAKDREVLKLKTAPIQEAIEQALRRFEALTDPGEVDLKLNLESRNPVAHDRDGIASALLNLLINSYKYTGKDKQIDLRTIDGKGEVILEVEDNGIGIPLVDRRRIFEPFFRVDSRLRAQSSGAGLGLAIVRAQVDAHGGAIRVRSTEGEGTCMSIHLPVAEDADLG
jgi:two-component system, OmpR family, phosphate regulon sensor histidine kinase PhoR